MKNTLTLSTIPLPDFANKALGKLPKSNDELVNTLRSKALCLLPELTRPVLKRLPLKWQSYLLLPLLENIFSQEIIDGDFAFLQQKWLSIEITDLGIIWWLSYNGEKLIMADNNEDNDKLPDVTFTAKGDDLLLIAGRKQDPDTLFFQRKLTISGDTELGLEVKNLIDGIDIEQLPKHINHIVSTLATWINDHNSNKKALTSHC